jgi:2-C-methyl-D-erythritol 4-phosphate cytidylyltransferase
MPPKKTHKIWSAIVPAAGMGSRFVANGSPKDVNGSSLPKQFQLIQGKPLLYHTLAALEGSGQFKKIIVALDAQHHRDFIDAFVIPNGLGKNVEYVAVIGGATRSASVYAGLLMAEGSDYVAIHDGARPCLRSQLIAELIAATEEYQAVIPGYPLHDSIKELQHNPASTSVKKDDVRVMGRSLDRRSLWAVQTPQCFNYSLVLKSYQQAIEKQWQATDDAEVVEKSGHSVHLIMGDVWNIKVTYAQDVSPVSSLLESIHV